MENFFEIAAFAQGETAADTSGTTESTGADNTQPQTGQAGIGGMVSMFLPMVIIIALLYFMMIRPQRKREKEAKTMLDAMKVGDKVVTIGGICGKVVKIKDEFVFIESGNIGTENEKSVLKMERDAIKSVEKKIKN